MRAGISIIARRTVSRVVAQADARTIACIRVGTGVLGRAAAGGADCAIAVGHLPRKDIAKVVRAAIAIGKNHQLAVRRIAAMRKFLVIGCVRADAVDVAGVSRAAIAIVAIEGRKTSSKSSSNCRPGGAGNNHPATTKGREFVPDSGCCPTQCEWNGELPCPKRGGIETGTKLDSSDLQPGRRRRGGNAVGDVAAE